ncbi:MAG TPA: hypothetical protein VN681_04350 [Stellaceae bacterium]|nr:hypothetical protein [Stellaceae bacterium]
MIKAIAVAASLLAGASLAAGIGSTPADARGFVAVGIGVPLFPPYYAYPPPVVYAPPPVVYAPSPVVVQQPTQYWYYCDNPAGYYPYVPSCPTPWRPVTPQPGSQPGGQQ